MINNKISLPNLNFNIAINLKKGSITNPIVINNNIYLIYLIFNTTVIYFDKDLDSNIDTEIIVILKS